jgi:group II intron reverse transcriptase/maturase
MRNADVILAIHQERGSKGLPLERVYKHLFDPEFFLRAYGKIYRNDGAMTKGTTEETVDGMSVQKIHGIINLLRQERYRWKPVRRTEIPKAKGGTRPLGIPTWGDKLVQEVIRTLLEPYYEQRFSPRSHGFRPDRSCHTALREVWMRWKGTVWFIEGDIKGAFDNVDHQILLEIIRQDIHDGRLLGLIEGLLKAGYMKDWRFHDTLSGTPQGGIISPLLFNIYLTELDRFVEDTLIPAYTRGNRRKDNPEYTALSHPIAMARKRGDAEEVARLKRARRKLMSVAPVDPDYRRLRYIRYADDFLLGFSGPKKEAEAIRERLGEFLAQKLRLTLSKEKTLITHGVDDKAKFLGHEIGMVREENLITGGGKRNTNGKVALLMPRTVVQKYLTLYCKNGKVMHRAEMVPDSDYTILSRYQSVYTGLYQFYCMTVNVSTRMADIKRILWMSAVKTLSNKFRISATEVVRRYGTWVNGYRALRVVIERPDKEPLTATFAGIPLRRVPEGMGKGDFSHTKAWYRPGYRRSEIVQRLLVGECELCGRDDLPTEVHHIRKLADIDKPGRKPKEGWKLAMSARKRKTLVLCNECHGRIHAGQHDGPKL